MNNKKIRPNASLTVETSLVLPLFMFFCIQFMSIISLLQLHSALEAAMHQEVAKASLSAYTIGKAGIDISGGPLSIVNESYLKSKVIERAGQSYLDNSMIEGGSGGIKLMLSPSDTNQDVVDLVISYKVKPVVDILGFSGFSMGNRCRMKNWTGYVIGSGGADTNEDELVYVAENGSVYHKSRNCTHIMLSTQSVSRSQIEGLRNDEGGKYHSCEKCGSKAGTNVFITDQGNRYHSSISCSGLKRTVYTVRKSEAGGLGACTRCGG